MDRQIVARPRAHGEGDAHQLAAAMERPQADRARQPGKIVADHGGRRAPERLDQVRRRLRHARHGRGDAHEDCFPLRLFCHSARRRNVGSRRRGELSCTLDRWLGVTAWRNTMKSSVAAKQIAFRMSSYNGFATRRPHPDQPLRRQPSHSNSSVIFARIRHRTPSHVPAGGLQSRLHRPHLLTPS